MPPDGPRVQAEIKLSGPSKGGSFYPERTFWKKISFLEVQGESQRLLVFDFPRNLGKTKKVPKMEEISLSLFEEKRFQVLLIKRKEVQSPKDTVVVLTRDPGFGYFQVKEWKLNVRDH